MCDVGVWSGLGFSLAHPRLMLRIVGADFLPAVAARWLVSAAGRTVHGPTHDKRGLRECRRDRMAVAAGDRGGADDRVFHDVPAVGTHRVVAVGCGDAGYPDSACERGDQLGPVGKFERGGGGIGLGVARETARRDVKTCGAAGGDDRGMQAHQMADRGRVEVIGGGGRRRRICYRPS